MDTHIRPKCLLLTFGEYFQLNYDLSIAKGWTLGQDTERCKNVNPSSAKVSETEAKLVMYISSEERENYPELFAEHTLYSKSEIVLSDAESDVISDDVIEPDVIDWTLNHCEKQRVDTSNLVTYIASQDTSGYPTIPSEGEWCEAKIYSYNGDKVKCLQPHTRMHFTPEETPALWLIIPTVTEGYPDWVQPTGAHDAYQIGDRVTFNGNDYESVINANVWSPIAYARGWKQL